MIATPMSQPRAEQILRQSPIPALRTLQAEENALEVVLSGSVASYYLKQLAQETIMPLLGDRKLRNGVMVVRA